MNLILRERIELFEKENDELLILEKKKERKKEIKKERKKEKKKERKKERKKKKLFASHPEFHPVMGVDTLFFFF